VCGVSHEQQRLELHITLSLEMHVWQGVAVVLWSQKRRSGGKGEILVSNICHTSCNITLSLEVDMGQGVAILL
jgi:hypothetical protein